MKRRRHVRLGLDREPIRRRELEQAKLDQAKLEVRAPERSERIESSAPLSADAAAPAGATVPLVREAEFGPRRPGVRLPGQHVVCTWCGSYVAVKSRGPLPRFCSATCRHRAWEQERAARDGRVAVVAVERLVVACPHDAQGWVKHLERLTSEVRRGQLDEAELTVALDLVYAAVTSRQRRFTHDDLW